MKAAAAHSGPYLTPIEWEEDGVPPSSPSDFIVALAKDHGQPRGDAFVLPRSDIKKLTGKAEPNAVQAIFKRWTGQHVGNGYTMDVERADKNNAHMLVVRLTSTGDLTAEELSAHSDMAGLI